jgi:hypothetical protein
VITLGAGDVTMIGPEVLATLASRRDPARRRAGTRPDLERVADREPARTATRRAGSRRQTGARRRPYAGNV